MQRYGFLLVLILSTASILCAQRNNIWYFGRKAGLDFSSGTPKPLHNSAMDTEEGCASVCDDNGDLLFYTNGLTVYNRNHQIMLGGTDLEGNKSSMQSAIIVPQPGNNNIFYIFTTDAFENSFQNGYRYSVVDMQGDNGNGAVVIKNVLMSASCSERMVAVRHNDGVSVWVITNDNNSNVFKSWLINCSGLSSNPVVSTIGDVLDAYTLMNVGMMKISPDGKQLCQTHFPILDETIKEPNFAQLFDFDNATGILSNARKIQFSDAQITACEYSPNSQLLYLSRAYDKKIDQVECKLTDINALLGSRVTMTTTNASFQGMQLGPDQKIYLSWPSNFIGGILNPNTKGTACNLVISHINVNEGISGSAFVGLPAFINDFSVDANSAFTYTILDSCTGRIQFNANSSLPGALTWNWNFDDGLTDNTQNPIHNFPATKDIYTVKLNVQSSGGCAVVTRSKKIIPRGVVINPEFDFVVRCDSNYVRFVNKTSFVPDTAKISYSWDFDDNNTTSNLMHPKHSFSDEGSFDVSLNIKTTTVCLNKSVNHTVPVTKLNVTAATSRMEIDAGQTVQLSVTGGGNRFQWTPGTGLSNATSTNPVAKPEFTTWYKVTAFNNDGCKDEDSVLVTVKQIPGIYVPSAFTPNNDGKNDIFRPMISYEYQLQEFAIFNRWGEKIFTTSKKETGWDGKVRGVQQDTGVYIWTIYAIDTRTGKRQEMKGTFAIVQ
jgi:gliding motility-associated-like protein